MAEAHIKVELDFKLAELRNLADNEEGKHERVGRILNFGFHQGNPVCGVKWFGWSDEHNSDVVLEDALANSTRLVLTRLTDDCNEYIADDKTDVAIAAILAVQQFIENPNDQDRFYSAYTKMNRVIRALADNTAYYDAQDGAVDLRSD